MHAYVDTYIVLQSHITIAFIAVSLDSLPESPYGEDPPQNNKLTHQSLEVFHPRAWQVSEHALRDWCKPSVQSGLGFLGTA